MVESKSKGLDYVKSFEVILGLLVKVILVFIL